MPLERAALGVRPPASPPLHTTVAVAWSGDGEAVATAHGGEHVVAVWAMPALSLVAVLSGCRRTPYSIAFAGHTPHAWTLVAVDLGSKLRVWRVAKADGAVTVLAEVDLGGGAASSLSIAPGWALGHPTPGVIATTVFGASVWDGASTSTVRATALEAKLPVVAIRRIARVLHCGTAVLVAYTMPRPSRHQEPRTLDVGAWVRSGASSELVPATADSVERVTVDARHGNVHTSVMKLFTLVGDSLRCELRIAEAAVFIDASVATCPDSRLLAASMLHARGFRVEVFHLRGRARGSRACVLPVTPRPAAAVSLASGGARLALVASSRDPLRGVSNVAEVWAVNGAHLLARLRLWAMPNVVSFAPDGLALLVGTTTGSFVIIAVIVFRQ
ncbi:uncharacterized protein AMSG_05804 [Thecamonas trahens ATCC 50062]|uniref:Uncharacterized protein n=1 Tax=Thecamonas trahens ATCC 50062 TaxID=461836 RepID=A0A0L0DFF2_THETB|nr:hypothetical protein AMSG_05804 [Thecamonas trahens ATCC 50062]KNC50043.1 hypothetical protein AMSG_05804 [Thecamonas trahens ATCC 50062]|eukprot:XP_013757209.1 hypothetical protein AMSG_05804 [Thecamonas trahens ATCC 50062]